MAVENPENTEAAAALPEHCLVIVYDPATGSAGTLLRGSIPHAALVNALELVKFDLLAQQKALARQAMARKIMPGGGAPLPPFRG